jgi:CBS domain-containing protein
MDQQAQLSGLKVSHLMSSNVITIEEHDSVSFVIKVFDRCHISGAPVVNANGEYVGVISKTDLFDKRLLEFLKQHGSLEDLPVRYIMSDNKPMAVPETTSVERASEVMLNNHIHRIFVKDSFDRIIGVVSSYDILRVVAGSCPQQLPQQPTSSNVSNLKEQQILNIREQLNKNKAKQQGR